MGLQPPRQKAPFRYGTALPEHLRLQDTLHQPLERPRTLGKPFLLPLRVEHRQGHEERRDDLSRPPEPDHADDKVKHGERHEYVPDLRDDVQPLPPEGEEAERPVPEHQPRADRHHGALPEDITGGEDEDARGAGVHREPAVEPGAEHPGEIERGVEGGEQVEPHDDPSGPVPREPLCRLVRHCVSLHVPPTIPQPVAHRNSASVALRRSRAVRLCYFHFSHTSHRSV